MKIIKKYRALLIIALAAVAGIFFSFYRMYHDDIKALNRFMASYDSFERIISFHTDRGWSYALDKAGEAVIELQARASLRLSSLIRSEAELMDQAREVADLSRRELDSLRAVDALVRSRNPDQDEVAKEDELEKECSLLRGKRKAAYVRFRELAGLKD